jgi:hypothetical protein
MCHFIKLVLPAQADVGALREVMQRHGRLLEPCCDPHLDGDLAPDERAFLTRGNCDCGTALVRPRGPRREHDEGREPAKLRRSGWSEAKIQRWRQQRAGVVTRKAEARARTREHESEQWRALLEDLLGAKVEHIGLVVHWVTAGVHRGPVFPRTHLNAETLSTLEENILYTFAAR